MKRFLLLAAFGLLIQTAGIANENRDNNKNTLTNEAALQEWLQLTPNPALHHLFVSFHSKNPYLIEIFNYQGTRVYNKVAEFSPWEIDISGLERGYYFVIINHEGKSHIKRLVKL
jgi:hypothetical protein